MEQSENSSEKSSQEKATNKKSKSGKMEQPINKNNSGIYAISQSSELREKASENPNQAEDATTIKAKNQQKKTCTAKQEF